MVAISNSSCLNGDGIWVEWGLHKGNSVPDNAVVGGNDEGPLYVMRAWHEGKLLPGKFNPTWGSAFISWEGVEIRKPIFEVS